MIPTVDDILERLNGRLPNLQPRNNQAVYLCSKRLISPYKDGITPQVIVYLPNGSTLVTTVDTPYFVLELFSCLTTTRTVYTEDPDTACTYIIHFIGHGELP